MKKTISYRNGKITIEGNEEWVPIEYKEAEWSDGEEIPCFEYENDYIFLDEITVTDPRGPFSEYDGILNFSYFDGILIKLSKFDNIEGIPDAVQVYYFYC